MARLIFLGPPGAGKGTQAAILAQLFGVPHISTGEILRTAVANETELGLKVKSYMDEGELVPDSLILDLVRERLKDQDAGSGWILDGFPRNVAQANFLDHLLTDIGQVYDYVVDLEVADDTIVDRLLHRGRKDDTETVIRHRLQVYREQTEPLIDFYRQREQLVAVNGDRNPESVATEIKHLIHA